MLMALRQWRQVSGLVILVQILVAVLAQVVEWFVWLERSVCRPRPQPLPVLAGSPLGRSRGGRRTRLSVEVPNPRPAQHLPSATRPSSTVPVLGVIR